MITLREINEENYEECIYLKLTKEQQKHIASNCYSLSEAYVFRNSLEVQCPFAIYKDETMIGFTMFHYSPYIEGEEDFDEPIFYMSRFMIDIKFQGNGYSKEAMKRVLEYVKNYDKHVDAIVLSCNENNSIAFKLYESFGFVDEGEKDGDGDNYMRLIM